MLRKSFITVVIYFEMFENKMMSFIAELNFFLIYNFNLYNKSNKN